MRKTSEDIEANGERFGRAKKPTAPKILEMLQMRASSISFEVASYYGQMLIHRAHVVMLVEQEILTRKEGADILRGLKKIEAIVRSNDSLTSYMATETILIQTIGEIGGKMHIGRSRNDLGATQRRIFYRDQIERLIETIIAFRRALVDKAEHNVNTVMPGYTHWRQAQPITLAHYIMAHVDAAERCIDQLEDIYRRTDLNTLGAAALAGTGWPINRERTRELLGFKRLCENTYDCVAAHDYVVEFASAIALHLSNLSRLAEDLEIWSSDEFAIVDLDEAYAGTSSIMPQKKNPSSLEMVKRFAAEAIGALVSIITSLKGVAYTNILDRVMLEPVSIDTAIGITKVTGGIISTLVPRRKTMLAYVTQGFGTMTDVVDMLVNNSDLSFRQAHDIIAETVSKAISEGRTANQISQCAIRASATKSIGKKLAISEEQLQNAIDPITNIQRRCRIGGPAPVEVKRMISDRRTRISLEESRHKNRCFQLNRAYKQLERAERQILESS
jgi:argininosuccinate lyase